MQEKGFEHEFTGKKSMSNLSNNNVGDENQCKSSIFYVII